MFDFAKAVQEIEFQERDTYYVLEDAYDAGVNDGYTAASKGSDYIYRIVERSSPDQEWRWSYRGGYKGPRTYLSAGAAKGAITQIKNMFSRWGGGRTEFKIQRAPLSWEDVDV
jgi:hypothetical protein